MNVIIMVLYIVVLLFVSSTLCMLRGVSAIPRANY